jgi:hypothetical protein
MKGGVFVGQTPYTAMFIITNELSRKYPSLAKRGEGRFYDDVLTTKIPPNLPFPKGGISDIFMLLFESKVHVRFISKYLILSFYHSSRKLSGSGIFLKEEGFWTSQNDIMAD